MDAMTIPDAPHAAVVPAVAVPRAAPARAAAQLDLTELMASLAPEWFRMVEWVGVTALIHACATITDSTLLVAVKWLSYLMLFAWVSHKIDRALLWLVQRSKTAAQSIESLRLVVAVGVGGTLIPTIYIFVQYLVIVLVTKLGG